MKKLIKIILLSFVFFLGFFIGLSFSKIYDNDSLVGESLRQTDLPEFIDKETEDLNKETKESVNLIFVGDMMFDRGVEYQIEKYKNFNFPFQQLGVFLNNADIVFGNLEGPIVNHPKNFSSGSLKFAFSSSTAETLQKNNFTVLSLANNHTLNMGEIGLQETRSFLRKKGIEPLGDTIGCSKNDAVIIKKFVFAAFNKTFDFNCSKEEIEKTLKNLKQENPDKFLIVSMHWGQEYQETNSSVQQGLAHMLIDAGADLIIGHHPHVVQNIEEYKGKLIFYSLGNFIFDQYFSEEVKKGLVIGLEVNEANLKYTLYPVYTATMAQPSLMQEKSKELFLKSLAGRSNDLLSKEIENAIIERDIQ